MSTKKKILYIIILFFLIIRIGIAIFAGEKESEFIDAKSYNSYANAICNKYDWLIDPNFYGDYRPPGYPFFIAIIYFIFGIKNYIAVYIFQAILNLLTILFIYKFSKILFDEKVAFLSLLWAGFYIPYLLYIRLLVRETLVIFLLMFLFYHLYKYLVFDQTQARKIANFSILAITFITLIHTDPRYIFFLPGFVFLFLIFRPFFVGTKKYFIFLVFTVLLMIPWTIRNYIAYKGFILINIRTLDLRDNEARNEVPRQRLSLLNFGEITRNVIGDYPTNEERELIISGFNPNNRTEEEIVIIKKNISPTSSFLGRKWFQFKEFWRPFRFKAEYSPFPYSNFCLWSLRHNLSSIISYGILLPFMILAVITLFKKRKKVVWFLIFPLFFQCFFHVLLYAIERYRHPVDAFTIILGSYGIVLIYNFFLKKYREKKGESYD